MDQPPKTKREPDTHRDGTADLKGSPEWQEAIFEGSRDAIFISDEDSRFVAVNRAACDLTGYSREELLNLRIPDLLEDADLGAYNQHHDFIMAGQTALTEAALLRKDGTKVPTEFNSSMLVIGGTQYMHTTSRDITERRLAEAAFRERDELCQKIFDGANDAIIIVALDGRILEANITASHRLGYTIDELKRRTVAEIDSPEAIAKIPQRIARIQGEGHAIFETVQQRRDGTRIPTEVSSRVIEYRGAVAILSILRDLSERKRAEQQLVEAQKVQTVGRLAAGIAHDFNNLLQAMLLQTQLLGSGTLSTEASAVARAEMEDQVQRGKSLVRQLLLFSRHEKARPEPLDLNDLVANATRMLRRLVPANVAFSQQLNPEPLYIDGDRNQLEQVLLNLVVNASDAMPEGGTLVIRTGSEGDDSTYLSVADTGQGMPPEIRDRIFEPFFTTKTPERGTGLGLAVVHNIVTNHAGHIDVVTEVDHGTTFKIVLPAVPPPQQVAAATGASRPVPLSFPTQGAGERILVVEDEAGARDALQQVLQALGYVVTITGSAEEAGLLPEDPPFRVVLTDLMLPGILGTELVAGLRDRWPDLRVILMSGYLPDDSVQHEIDSGRIRFLQKPFDIPALAAEVQAALAGGS